MRRVDGSVRACGARWPCDRRAGAKRVDSVSGGVFTNELKVLCRLEQLLLRLRPLFAADQSVDSCLAKPRLLISILCAQYKWRSFALMLPSVLANEGLLWLTTRTSASLS